MAKENVQPSPDDALSDEQMESVLQVDALLTILRRNLGGEAESEDQVRVEDVFRTLMVAQQFLESALEDETPIGGEAPKVRLMSDALAVIRGITSSAFIAAKDSVIRKIQLGADEVTILNAIWAASRLISEARGNAR